MVSHRTKKETHTAGTVSQPSNSSQEKSVTTNGAKARVRRGSGRGEVGTGGVKGRAYHRRGEAEKLEQPSQYSPTVMTWLMFSLSLL
jgi:hypothetical protein